MKRLTLLLLCITTLGLVSCQKDTIINQTTPNRTIVFDMAPSQWVLSNGEYFLDLNIPELDDINFYDEGVLVYTATPNFTSYYQLPYGDFDYEAHIGGISISCAYRPSTTIRVKVVLIAAENVT